MMQLIASSEDAYNLAPPIDEALQPMLGMVRLRCTGADAKVGARYIFRLEAEIRHVGLVTQIEPHPQELLGFALSQLNSLLREIHLLLGLPQWRFIVERDMRIAHWHYNIWKETIDEETDQA